MNEQLKVVITAEINKLKTELGKGQKLLSGFKEAGAKAGKTVGVAEKTRDYRKQQAQLAASFRAAGSTA